MFLCFLFTKIQRMNKLLRNFSLAHCYTSRSFFFRRNPLKCSSFFFSSSSDRVTKLNTISPVTPITTTCNEGSAPNTRLSQESLDNTNNDTNVNLPKKTYFAKFKLYLLLARADKPVGTLLLFLPCAWSLQMALYSIAQESSVASVASADLMTSVVTLANGALPAFGKYLGLFAVGSLAMRSAGCVINDLWDRNIDREVARTRSRPRAP